MSTSAEDKENEMHRMASRLDEISQAIGRAGHPDGNLMTQVAVVQTRVDGIDSDLKEHKESFKSAMDEIKGILDGTYGQKGIKQEIARMDREIIHMSGDITTIKESRKDNKAVWIGIGLCFLTALFTAIFTVATHVMAHTP